MKIRTLIILIVLVLLLLCIFENSLPEEVSGYIRNFSFQSNILVLNLEEEDDCYFLVTDETELKYDDPDIADSFQKNQRWDHYLRYDMHITVKRGETVPVENRAHYEEAKHFYYAEVITINRNYADHREATTAKPVIYLYPEEETDVTVKLSYHGDLTCTYPAYKDGWSVTAAPDGTLTDAHGQTYNYLYWEGKTDARYDFSSGFCVAGSDTAAFLEDALAKLGLNRREANEFIVYWLPLMEENPYNLISFQQQAYTDHAELDIFPAPDTLIRVFMAWKPLNEAVKIPQQELTAPQRTGFTAVEWGGCRLD